MKRKYVNPMRDKLRKKQYKSWDGWYELRPPKPPRITTGHEGTE